MRDRTPNKTHAAWGRRAHRLDPDPATAPVVRWIFAQRLAGHSVARIARALNEAGVPCPSAADLAWNTHRSGTSWTLGTVTTILENPRYTGRQVWNRQRTDTELADPSNVTLGHRSVQRWNLPDGWVKDKLLPHLPALHLLLTSPAVRARRRTRSGADARSTVSPGEVIGYLREHEITLTWNPASAALQARATQTAKAITVTAR